MRVNNKKRTNNIAAENEETLVESQKFMEPLSKKKKRMGEKQKLIKKKERSFRWTKEMIEYLLDSLKRYKVMCNFSRKDFDADKSVQNSKLRKEIPKIPNKYEVLLHLKLLLTQELIYQFSRGKNLRQNKIRK